MNHTRFVVAALLMAGARLSVAATYHVATNGADRNAGTHTAAPFRTIGAAASRMKAGDTCLIHAGTYHEEIVVSGLSGTESEPIVFAPYGNDQVVLDGTEAIAALQGGAWTQHSGNIYKTTLSKDIWQLFDDGEMAMAARWPNAQLVDGSVWDQDGTWAHAADDSSFGRWVVNVDNDHPNLAATGRDFTGAMAILNIGIWQTHSRGVNSHVAGSNTFTYDTDNPKVGDSSFWSTWQKQQHRTYLECHLSCLDTANEWYYNPATKALYYWASDGQVPAGNIRGKTATFAFDINRSCHVALRGFAFFSSTFRIQNSSHCSVADCNLEYYECTKRMLGVKDPGLNGHYTCETRMTGSYNTLLNCRLSFCDGGAFSMRGERNRFENVLAHDLDWSGVGYHTFHFQGSSDTLVRRVTAYRAGASECINGGRGNRIELCDMGEGLGVLQRPDGAAIQIRPEGMNKTVVRYNWSHDHSKFGLRFDGDFWDVKAGIGLNGTFHHNVVWGLQPPGTKPAIKVKGDYNKIYNNLSFDNKGMDIEIQGSGKNPAENAHTTTRNNACGELAGDRIKADFAVPGTHSKNLVDTIWPETKDADNRDFRPKAGSALIDAGDVIPGITDGYLGRAPDIGPYEYGDKNYWIPGFQTTQASKPIPADGAENAKSDSALIWLGGYQGTAYEIYIGLDREAVATADTNSPLFRGRQQNNIYTPKKIPAGKTCYWRIDTINRETVAGKVWQFKKRN